MRHEPAASFHGTPRGSRKVATEAEIRAKVYTELDPLGQAREDSLRHDDDPNGLAAHFAERIVNVRGRELGIVRSDVLSAVQQELDEAGLLVDAVEIAEPGQLVKHIELQAERAQIEQRKHAEVAIENQKTATATYEAWSHETGAKPRHTPWPRWLSTLFVLALAGFLELCVMAAVLQGPPIEGVPTGFVLGLLFAANSVMVGVLGGTGTSLVADLRGKRKALGAVVLFIAFVLWTVAAVAGAHLRGVIEAGGSGTVDEIIASLHRGLFRPFASPLALFLVGASAFAAGVAWWKWSDFIGWPLGHRGKDLERLHTEEQLHLTEEDHRAAVIVGVIRLGLAQEDEFVVKAWQPANNGQRLEREIAVIVAQGRECVIAIDRITKAIVADYVAATRRLRSGVNVAEYMVLPDIGEDGIGEPESFRAKLEALTIRATAVTDAVATAKDDLHLLEVEHTHRIDALYGLTRPRHSATAEARGRVPLQLQPKRN
jgi:hypothetical protein